ncbi:LysR family transcriptional regulator [Maridesulfovibrio zosterae]|uniref:LysR family transcriptional regulator n=1 Tax=Maridesulfovibrio zosterae TaxID=82171 RepID=UPI0003F8C522|nr:LysR family transcriptional regulator [Maridesulfovibrio zosterae]
MLPDLNRLKIFYHIFNEKSSTEAAKLLHITQSGVSQHLKKLEEELQTALFTRVNRRLIPTAAGTKLYEVVKTFMLDLEHGVRQLNETSERPSGKLRIGTPYEFGKKYIPKIFASFHRMYPAASLQLELGDPKILFSMVSEGQLDFAYIDILPIMMDTPGGISAYTIEPVATEEFVLACSRNFYQQRVGRASYKPLTNLEYIGYKTDTALFKSWFKLHFETEPSSLNLAFTADSAEAIIAAIEEGIGLGITVSHLMHQKIASGTIVAIRPTPKKLQNTIACVQFKNKEITITEKVFQEHLRNELNKNYAMLDLT